MDSPTHHCSLQPKNEKQNWSSDKILRLVKVMAAKQLNVNGRFRPPLTQGDKKSAWADITNAISASKVLVRWTEKEVINKWFTVLFLYHAAIRKECIYCLRVCTADSSLRCKYIIPLHCRIYLNIMATLVLGPISFRFTFQLVSVNQSLQLYQHDWSESFE